jgi:hypothetical protein
MPRWRIDIIRSRLERLGTVTAPNEKLAITRAAEQFHIAPARQNKIIVIKISERGDD